MTDKKPNHRWFRFSLRILFVVLTVACIVLACVFNQVRLRKSLIEKLKVAGAKISYSTNQSSWRSRYFGDSEVSVIHFQKGFADTHYDLLVQAKKSFAAIRFGEYWVSGNEAHAGVYEGKNHEFSDVIK